MNSSGQELSGLRLDLTLLRSELRDWKNIPEAQASEINRLLPQLAEQDKISMRQAELLGVTLKSNKWLKMTLCIAVPVAAAAGLIIGVVMGN